LEVFVKRIIAVFFLALFAVPAWAQEKGKIGLIDIQKAISDSQAGKKARERFQAQVKKTEADLMREKGDVEKLKTEVEKKGPLMKEDDRKNLEKELQRRVLNYQRNLRDSQEELQQKERDMTNEILKDLEKVVADFGKNEKYGLILERSTILYSDSAMDVTTKVVDLYNNRGAPAKAPAKAK
jgi:outer membrane protein